MDREHREDVEPRSIMTFRQAVLFVIYYAILQFTLVVIAGLLLRRVIGPHVTWRGLLLAFILLACCGPIFIVLIRWFRAARQHPGPFAIRFGLSMSAMVTLYALMLTVAAQNIGLSFFSLTALPSYLVVTAIIGFPLFSLTAYLLGKFGDRNQPE